MALADPQSVTLTSGAVSLPRTGLTLNEGQFGDSTGEITLTALKTNSKNRTRNTIRLRKDAIVSDPLVPTQNTPTAYSVHFVSDRAGSTVPTADAVELAKALVGWLSASSNANLIKLIQGEL